MPGQRHLLVGESGKTIFRPKKDAQIEKRDVDQDALTLLVVGHSEFALVRVGSCFFDSG